MNIIHKFSKPNNSLWAWLLHVVIVLAVALLVLSPDMDAAAARRRASAFGHKDERALEQVQQPSAVVANGRRVALVIGNSNYQDPSDNLSNPLNDAADIARNLRKFGFQVQSGTDLTNAAMREMIADFGRLASNADVALFYYAGHGVQSKSQNYLIPVDAKLLSEAALEYESVNLNLPLEELSNAQSRINIVMLDACRNNDFSGKFRSKQRGLAVPAGVPRGTVIMYATAPGETAADGNRRNGLFTEGVLKAFRKGKNLSLDRVIKTTSRYVETESRGAQTPYSNGSETVKEDFYFAGGPVDDGGDNQREKELEARLAEAERLLKEARNNPPVVKKPRPVVDKEPATAVVVPIRKTNITSANATNRALLIGISAYKKFPLDGPVNDVTALKQILPRWGFTSPEINILQDQQATRSGVVQALTDIAERSKSGDKILFYFSGHGSSSEDTYGSSLAPIDINETGSVSADKALLEKKDILPILEVMDRKGAQVLAVYDTSFGCPSHNSNVIYLSASSKGPALDHSRSIAATTVDGLAHGAFTNALLKVLRGEVMADANGDQELSSAELYTAVSPLLSQRYRQTPCIIPKPNKDPNNVTTRGFFVLSNLGGAGGSTD